MILTADQLTDLAQVAVEAAVRAGRYISKTRPLNVQKKSAGENLASQILTEVDLASQELILGVLEPTFSRFDLALLTEESKDDGSRQKKDYFWCIDPMDGTLPFVEEVPGYSVSIALVSRAGVPHMGVVYDPVKGTLYHAIRGGGVYRNQTAWSPVAEDYNPAELQVFTDRSVIEESWFKQTAQRLNVRQVTAQGGAVMNAIWALEHPPACYFKFPKEQEGGGSIWDYAATACLYSELGLFVSDIHGNPLALNDPETTFMNRGGMVFSTHAELAEQIKNSYVSLKRS